MLTMTTHPNPELTAKTVLIQNRVTNYEINGVLLFTDVENLSSREAISIGDQVVLSEDRILKEISTQEANIAEVGKEIRFYRRVTRAMGGLCVAGAIITGAVGDVSNAETFGICATFMLGVGEASVWMGQRHGYYSNIIQRCQGKIEILKSLMK